MPDPTGSPPRTPRGRGTARLPAQRPRRWRCRRGRRGSRGAGRLQRGRGGYGTLAGPGVKSWIAAPVRPARLSGRVARGCAPVWQARETARGGRRSGRAPGAAGSFVTAWATPSTRWPSNGGSGLACCERARRPGAWSGEVTASADGARSSIGNDTRRCKVRFTLCQSQLTFRPAPFPPPRAVRPPPGGQDEGQDADCP